MKSIEDELRETLEQHRQRRQAPQPRPGPPEAQWEADPGAPPPEGQGGSSETST